MPEPTRAPELWLQEAWHGRASPAARAGLTAAAAAYRVALAARTAAYRAGLLTTRALPVPVISVGNITVGGSGKTPLAEIVVLELVNMGVRPAVIARGYGRRSRGVRIVADAGGVRLGARDAGDEPVLLAERLPGVPVVVGESRYDAGATAVATPVEVTGGEPRHRGLAQRLQALRDVPPFASVLTQGDPEARNAAELVKLDKTTGKDAARIRIGDPFTPYEFDPIERRLFFKKSEREIVCYTF